MEEIDLEQRAEEIELTLAGLFDSPKQPAISSYDDGSNFFVQSSWVVESHGDTTLDSRCVLTLRLTTAQFHRYAHMDTAKRIIVRERLSRMVRERLPLNGAPASMQEACSAELTVDDRILQVDQQG